MSAPSAVKSEAMTYVAFLSRVIDDGISAVRVSYARDAAKLGGAIAGFEACRGKTPEELRVLLAKAHEEVSGVRSAGGDVARYWSLRCREAEIEWTCNVVSVVLANEGLPVIVEPTARGFRKAAEIVGVASTDGVARRLPEVAP